MCNITLITHYKRRGTNIARISLLGSQEKVTWSQAADALTINLPKKIPNNIAIVFKITI